jgi:hypothetical protein
MMQFMDTARQSSADTPASGKYVINVRLERDLYEWLVHEARERRSTLAYAVRDILHKAKLAQEKGAQ